MRSTYVSLQNQERGLLQAVREVFAGLIPRSEIALQLPPNERVYAGVAIMLALPQFYLLEGCIVKEPLNHSLNGLLLTGVSRQESEPPRYAAICKRRGLYETLPGPPRQLRLTPTPGLVALVEELGATEPVKTFHCRAVEAVARARAEAAAAVAVTRDEEATRADEMIEYIIGLGGEALLWRTLQRWNERAAQRRR